MVWGRSIVAYCCWPAAVLPSVLVAALVFAAVVIAVSLSPIATFFASAATTARSFLTLFNAVSA